MSTNRKEREDLPLVQGSSHLASSDGMFFITDCTYVALYCCSPPLRALSTTSHSHICSDGRGCCARRHLLITFRPLSGSIYECWRWNCDLTQYLWCPVAAENSINLIYSALMSKKDLFQRGEIRFKLFFAYWEKKKRTNECDCVGFRNYKTEFCLVLSAIRCLFIFINFAVVHPVLLSSLNPLHSSSFFILSSSFSPDSISSLSSLRIPSSLPSRFLSRSNSVHLCVHTPGCCGNGGRPHKRVDEQKTRRPSSTEMERGRRREAKSNFICMYIFF